MYPAIMSSIENKEMQIVSKVMAQLKGSDNVGASRYQSHMQILSSHITTPSSPTPPLDPTFSSTSSSKESSNIPTTIVQQQDQGEDKMGITSISSGKAVHTIWGDNTPGNDDIFYKRAGADYDPTTINLSNNAGVSSSPAIAVSGNNCTCGMERWYTWKL